MIEALLFGLRIALMLVAWGLITLAAIAVVSALLRRGRRTGPGRQAGDPVVIEFSQARRALRMP
jgi:hypothetical protein